MLIVFAANDGLQVQLGAASVAPLKIVGAYRGVDSTNYNPRPFRAQTNGTTPVEFLAGDGTEAKVVDFMTIKNPNAANVEVILSWEIGGTVDEYYRVVLAQQERIEYQDGEGFRVFTSAGAVKTSLNQGNNATTSGQGLVVLGADVTNNNAVANTIADITGLLVPLTNGQRIGFEAWIRYTAQATTTGSRFSVLAAAGFSELTYDSDVPLTTTSQTTNRSNAANDLPAAVSASSPQTTLGNLAVIRGIIRPSADGNLQFRFASEIANSAIVAKAGSHCKYWNC